MQWLDWCIPHHNRKGFIGNSNNHSQLPKHSLGCHGCIIGQAKYHKHQRLTQKSNNYVLPSSYGSIRIYPLTVLTEIKQQHTIHNRLSTVAPLGVSLNSHSHPQYTPLHSILERSDEIRILNKNGDCLQNATDRYAYTYVCIR